MGFLDKVFGGGTNLELKLDRQVLPPGLLSEATRIAHAVAEVTNVPPASRQP